jgi:hypothetical protein
MAGAAGVDDAIRLCEILSGRPPAKRMSSLSDEMLALDDLNQIIFAHSNAINNLFINVSKLPSQTALQKLFVWRP